MPYPNEHACRLREPSEFDKDTFKRITRKHDGKEYSIIMGKLKNKDTMTEQAYRYNKKVWTADSAKSHCEDHDGKFEAAAKEFKPMIEYKNVDFETKTDMDERTFEGYAAYFGNVDSWSDIIHKGAFKKTIRERGKAGKIKVFYNHMTPIGMPVEMKEDENGLFVTGKISRTAKGDEILELMRDKVISEMSIGYNAVKFDYDEIDNVRIRNLKEIKLFEFGPVDFAANDQAIITAVKQLSISKQSVNPEMIRETIKALNDIIESMEPEPPTPLMIEPDNHLITAVKDFVEMAGNLKQK